MAWPRSTDHGGTYAEPKQRRLEFKRQHDISKDTALEVVSPRNVKLERDDVDASGYAGTLIRSNYFTSRSKRAGLESFSPPAFDLFASIADPAVLERLPHTMDELSYRLGEIECQD